MAMGHKPPMVRNFEKQVQNPIFPSPSRPSPISSHAGPEPQSNQGGSIFWIICFICFIISNLSGPKPNRANVDLLRQDSSFYNNYYNIYLLLDLLFAQLKSNQLRLHPSHHPKQTSFKSVHSNCSCNCCPPRFKLLYQGFMPTNFAKAARCD